MKYYGVYLPSPRSPNPLKGDSSKELTAIRYFAEYLAAPSEKKEALAFAADKNLTAGVDDVIGPLMAANIHFYDGERIGMEEEEEAYRVLLIS